MAAEAATVAATQASRTRTGKAYKSYQNHDRGPETECICHNHRIERRVLAKSLSMEAA